MKDVSYHLEANILTYYNRLQFGNCISNTIQHLQTRTVARFRASKMKRVEAEDGWCSLKELPSDNVRRTHE